MKTRNNLQEKRSMNSNQIRRSDGEEEKRGLRLMGERVSWEDEDEDED